MKKQLTTEEFVKRAIKIHGDKYDYSKTDLNKRDKNGKILITCKLHGDFYQGIWNHLYGKGCKFCSRKIASYKKKSNTQEFIEKAKQVHGDKYDYSKVEYVGAKTKVCIICHEHGEFWQEPTNHLSGNGCPICIGKNKTNEILIKEFTKIHGDKYDYSKVEYIGNHKKVCIICPEHGEFWQTPANHLKGNGCPKCKASKIENNVKNVLNEINVNYLYQYIPSFLNNGKSHQSLDFYLPDYNIAIECQGIQHFKPVDFAGKGEEWARNLFENNVKRDICKENKCKKHDIKIVYINYFDDEKIIREKIEKICI